MASKIFSSSQLHHHQSDLIATKRSTASTPSPLPRRTALTLLTSPLLLNTISTPTSLASTTTITTDTTSLSSRLDILPNQGNLTQPRYNAPWEPKQIYYPRWMFGEWNVHSTFAAVYAPLGNKFVPEGFLQAAQAPASDGGVGSTYDYTLRFYSTLPDTIDNNLRVQLGIGMPHDAIIADKAYNTKSTTDAFLGYKGAVDFVEYDPRNAPLRQSVTLSRLGPDLMPLPPRRIELYTNRIQSSNNEEGSDGNVDDCTVFTTSELARQVFLAVRDVQVTDYEVLNEYRREGNGKNAVIQGKQRSILYLQPQDPLFFEAGNRAVAVYDYEFVMKRVSAPDDAPRGAIACVSTPKDVVQCL